MFKSINLLFKLLSPKKSEFDFENIPSRSNNFPRWSNIFKVTKESMAASEDEKISRKTAIWGNLCVREHSGILTPYFGRIAGRRDSPQNPSVIEREIQEEDSNGVGRTYRRGITMKRDNSNGIIFG